MKRLLCFGLLSAGCLLLLPAPTSLSAPPYTRLTDFYTDATFTVHTGDCYRNCGGAGGCIGTRTAFYVSEYDYTTCSQNYCCTRCTPGPCPPHILSGYPCEECPW